MIHLDLGKAFDCVRHDVLLNVLAYVVISKIIFDGVKTAHRNHTTRLIVNRRLTNRIKILPSVRQGCLL